MDEQKTLSRKRKTTTILPTTLTTEPPKRMNLEFDAPQYRDFNLTPFKKVVQEQKIYLEKEATNRILQLGREKQGDIDKMLFSDYSQIDMYQEETEDFEWWFKEKHLLHEAQQSDHSATLPLLLSSSSENDKNISIKQESKSNEQINEQDIEQIFNEQKIYIDEIFSNDEFDEEEEDDDIYTESPIKFDKNSEMISSSTPIIKTRNMQRKEMRLPTPVKRPIKSIWTNLKSSIHQNIGLRKKKLQKNALLDKLVDAAFTAEEPQYINAHKTLSDSKTFTLRRMGTNRKSIKNSDKEGEQKDSYKDHKEKDEKRVPETCFKISPSNLIFQDSLLRKSKCEEIIIPSCKNAVVSNFDNKENLAANSVSIRKTGAVPLSRARANIGSSKRDRPGEERVTAPVKKSKVFGDFCPVPDKNVAIKYNISQNNKPTHFSSQPNLKNSNSFNRFPLAEKPLNQLFVNSSKLGNNMSKSKYLSVPSLNDDVDDLKQLLEKHNSMIFSKKR